MIENLTPLREMAFAANRRLLHVQQLDHDPTLGQDEFETLTGPTVVDGQRASGLKFGDPVVLAVLTALLIFRLLPRGFSWHEENLISTFDRVPSSAWADRTNRPRGSNRDLRDHVAQLLTRRLGEFTPGQMTYHLRRLRLKGLIRRIPGTHRYEVTDEGLHAALFYTGTFSRVIRPLAPALHENGGRLQQRLLAQLRPDLANTSKKAAA